MNVISLLMSFVLIFSGVSVNKSDAAVSEPVVETVTEAEVVYEEVYEEDFLNDADEDIDEYVYCSVEADNVSIDYIIEPTEFVFNGENCAEIFVSLLDRNGFTPVYSGDLKEGFYLSAIEGIDTSEVSIPDDIKSYLNQEKISYLESVYTENCLSEFDITDFSGWMFTVNGEIPSCGMCDYIPQEGDEIKLVFTLNYGEDLSL